MPFVFANQNVSTAYTVFLVSVYFGLVIFGVCGAGVRPRDSCLLRLPRQRQAVAVLWRGRAYGAHHGHCCGHVGRAGALGWVSDPVGSVVLSYMCPVFAWKNSCCITLVITRSIGFRERFTLLTFCTCAYVLPTIESNVDEGILVMKAVWSRVISEQVSYFYRSVFPAYPWPNY